MAALHSALRSLGPCSFSDVPTSGPELDNWLAKLFADCQLVLESVPIADPDEAHNRPRSQTTSSIASNASEMSASSARSAPPSSDQAALQKEWGKPVKLSAKENPLGMSVYKTSGKDGKGAWFARRSVHQGLGFAKFKSGLQREFPESLEGGTGPGEGNIRGIGGERKVSDVSVKGGARIQTWQLSAQFPGPTTPRDFVTLLVTSPKAMKEEHHSGIPAISPRHWMIVSKPCNHPETQPRPGFIRGQYESVEFIREVPIKAGKSTSTKDLHNSPHRDRDTTSLEKDILTRNAQKVQLPAQHENRSTESLEERRHVQFSSESAGSRDMSPNSRKRAQTVGLPESATHLHTGQDLHSEHYDPEENPVEWIMITRSDPGGSVPRFMVERGTPSSIVADASKFLDWACQKDGVIEEDPETPGAERPQPSHRRESFASWQANGTLAGIEHEEEIEKELDKKAAMSMDGSRETFPDIPSPGKSEGTLSMESSNHSIGGSPASPDSHHSTASSGILASVTGVLAAYAPQTVLDHLPAGMSTPKAASSPALVPSRDVPPIHHEVSDPAYLPTSPLKSSMYNDDAASTNSTLTFASADSHMGSENGDPSISSKSTPEKDGDSVKQSKSKGLTPEEKEEANFAKRKAALDAKLLAAKEKYAKDASTQSEKVRKAEEKHNKQMEKEEEKYRKQLAKQEEKRQQQEKKEEEKRRKEAEKDEKVKLTRERDEFKKEAEGLKAKVELMTKQIGELQKENTLLMARIGKMENGEGGTGVMKLMNEEKREGGRSRSSSLLRARGAEGS